MSNAVDERRIAVWESMAEHFLDTETRHFIPATARLCLEAGLSVKAAHAVWWDEVVPVVGPNLMSVVGEWALWDRAWLVNEILALRRQGVIRRALRRASARGPLRFTSAPAWRALERCMNALLAQPEACRRQLEDDLTFLARHAFDFCAEPLEKYARSVAPEAIDRARMRLRGLAAEGFVTVFAPLFFGEDDAIDTRLRAALD